MSRGCIIFDLDGTLIDSRADLATGVNLMRGDFGLEPLPVATITSFIGDGARKLCERSLADSGIDVDAALPLMRRHYSEHLLDRTCLYPGVRDGLAELQSLHFDMAVVTNKPEEATRRLLAATNIESVFRFVIGAGAGFPLKPEPAALLHIMRESGGHPDHTWMVGDHYTDLESARRAGVIRVFAAWGFGNPQNEIFDFKADSFADLVTYVKRF